MTVTQPSLLDVAKLERLRELRRLHELRQQREQQQREQHEQAARRLVEPYVYDPVAWCHDCILWPDGKHVASYQADILQELAQHRRVAVRGPHGLGKSTTGSLAVLWFATTRDAMGWDWKIPTTASAWRHLSVFLWPEIHKWARLLNWAALGRDPFDERRELLSLTIKLRYGAATAVASNKPERIEGAHADSLLYVIDEGKIVPAATWDAIEGAFSGGQPTGLPEAFALAMSTPGAPSGRFYDIHRRARGLDDWRPIHVTLEQAIAAGRIARGWSEQRALQWGEDSALYHNRVLGEFWASDEDAVIPLAWLEAAVERWHEWDQAGRPDVDGARVVPVDVARSGADATVIGHRIAHIVTELTPHHREDTMRTTSRVLAAIGVTDEDDEQQLRQVAATPVVDSAGIGAGVVDRLRELRIPVLAYTGAAKTTARDRSREYGFKNVRSAAYWHMRELLDPTFGSEICLPPVEMLLSDLTTPTFDEETGVPPKIVVESKEDVVARLGRSPDYGDTVVMAFWADRMQGITRLHSPTTPRSGPQQAQRQTGSAAERYGRRPLSGAPGTGGPGSGTSRRR